MDKLFIILFLLLNPVASAMAGAGVPGKAEHIGLGLVLGHSYDPSPTFPFVQLSGSLQYDYDKVWPHRAPEPLYFKLETDLGGAEFEGDLRFVGSVNMFAKYYLHRSSGVLVKPYVEAGIGLIYTDFQVAGQGLRYNFNPQAGIGCDLKTKEGSWYVSFGIHHLSNGGLDDDNRGINSLLFKTGRYF